MIMAIQWVYDDCIPHKYHILMVAVSYLWSYALYISYDKILQVHNYCHIAQLSKKEFFKIPFVDLLGTTDQLVINRFLSSQLSDILYITWKQIIYICIP